MDDRAKPAQSGESNGNTPLTEWGTEVGDFQDSTDIDDAFAELLEMSPVRSSSDDSDGRPEVERPSADDLPGADGSADPLDTVPGTTTTDLISDDDQVSPTPGPDDGTFSLLGYLLEPNDQVSEPGAEAENGPAVTVGNESEAGTSTDVFAFSTDTDERSDGEVAGGADEADETLRADHDGDAEFDERPEADPPDPANVTPESVADNNVGDEEALELSETGLVIVERSTILNSGPAVERIPEPGPEFAPPSQRHPGDLVGSTLYSADDVDGDSDTRDNAGLLDALWQEPATAPAWHPDAPTNLQHSAVVEDSWEAAALPSRTVRSPGERRKPQTALDVVGDLTDRPGFWKSVAGVTFVAIGLAFYSVGFFDEVLGRGAETSASQVVRNDVSLPEEDLTAEAPDALGDLQSALSDDVGELEVTTGSGGADEPAAPARRVERSSVEPSNPSEEEPTTTTESTPEEPSSTTTAASSTTERTTSTSSSTSTTRRPTTTERSSTTRRPTTTTTEATTTTKRTPPSSGRPTTTSTTTTTTTTTTTSTTTTTEATTTTTEATTTTTEATTTTTEATTSTSDGGGEG